jgi:sulfide dehydrogenase cytochrome subunit
MHSFVRLTRRRRHPSKPLNAHRMHGTARNAVAVQCGRARCNNRAATRAPHNMEARMTHLLRMATALWLAAAGAAQAQDANLGRNLAATCASCHGTNGQARGETVAALAGMPAERLVTTFNAYKSGALPATIMHQIAKGYTDEQVKAIAAYFAAQVKK